jgi:hypothetical protein
MLADHKARVVREVAVWVPASRGLLRPPNTESFDVGAVVDGAVEALAAVGAVDLLHVGHGAVWFGVDWGGALDAVSGKLVVLYVLW